MKYIVLIGIYLILTFFLIMERVVKTIALIFKFVWYLKLQKKDFNIYKKYHWIFPGLRIVQFDTLKDYYKGEFSDLD